jgi:glucose-1-phosphate adenylyltransferase
MMPELVQRLGDADSPRFVSLLTKNTYGVILAGGRGSRLHHLTDWRAKPAVPFGGKFRIIDFPLSNCVNSGIRRIGVMTQYKSHSLIRHLQRGWSFLNGQFKEFIDLLPAQQRLEEEWWYRGTADAVFQNIDILRDHDPEFVLVLAGDHIYKMDYGKMLAYHVAKGADLTVACIEVPVEDATGFGVMGVSEDLRVTEFQEKPKKPNEVPGRPGVSLASMGVYVFNAHFLYEQLIRDADEPNSAHDFGKDIIPYLVHRYCVYAHRFDDSCVSKPGGVPYWRDVGTVDAYYEANMELTKVQPDLNMYDRDWPIWTYQEQLPPAKYVFDYDDKRGMSVDSLVSGGCIISGAVVRRSLLFSDVHVNEYSVVEDSVVLPNVEVGRGCIIRRAVIDRRCNIPDGMQIGVEPDEDKRRFFVTDKGVSLVTPDMLGQKVYVVR